MESARWKRLQEAFEAAAALPLEEREGVVACLCPEDPELAAEVMEMLAEDSRPQPILDASLDAISHSILSMDSSDRLVNVQIGPYRLLRVIGEGGMGVVYLAERTDIGGQVAIKLLRDAWLSPMRRERFASEQKVLAQFNHPAIARIYDASTLSNGVPYFVMEYADGPPLTEYLRQRGNTAAEDLTLFRRVCEAVQYAHGFGIIHRDLKPSNILVTSTGEVKLLDFGISKRLGSGGSSREATVAELRLMTPEYAAPEQFSGEAVGVFTDIYALGALVYEILTGERPVSRPKQDGPLKPSVVARSNGRRPELSRREWADLDVLCLKALQTDPARRYRSVDALMRDVDAFLRGEPLTARPNSAAYVLGKFVRRNRGPLFAVTAACLVLAAAILLFTVRLARARNAAVMEAEHTRILQHFTQGLFDGGDANAGPNLNYTAVEMLERGRAQADALRNDPQMQADMFAILGSVYQKLGRLHEAEPLLLKALDQRRRIFGENSQQAAESLVALGLLRKDEGRFPDAESLLRQAMTIQKQRLSHGHSEDGEHTSWALASVLNLAGQYREAETLLRQAVNDSAGKQPTPQAALDRSELADTEFYLANFKEAEVLYREALAMNRGLYGEQHPSVARNLHDLGEIAINRERWEEAEADLREAVSIEEAWYGRNHPEVAAMLGSLAKVYSGTRRFGQGEAMLQQALAIDRQVYGAEHPKVALVLNDLGVLESTSGKTDEAERYFLEALTIWRRAYGEHHQFVGLTYSNLAGIYADRKEYGKAERLYRDALTVYAYDKLGDSLNAAIVHAKLGRTLLHAGRYAEAEPESLAGAQYFDSNPGLSASYRIGAHRDLELERKHLQVAGAAADAE